MTVVGVVEDVKQFGLDAQDGPAVYTPYAQKQRDWKRWMTLAVRSELPPETLTQTVKEQIWAVDGELPVVEVSRLAEEVTSSAATERFVLVLLTSFAVLALLLTAGGIYAVLSYLVLQRRREVGLRIALGARPSEVRRMFVRQGMAVVGVALALGAGLAWLLTRWMSALLFEVEAADPPTFALAVVLLGAVAALACDLPAARLASRPDPVALLRTQ
jgi:ABC-type antimicrobial peptide transport system permease subunit